MQADLFGTLVSNIFFVGYCSRTNLKTALYLLTTRVHNPDEDDYKKLVHTILYIRATRGMEITLEAESMNSMQWCINATYSVHPDFKGHSRGMILLGKGVSASKLINHKINLKSSTESETIGVDNRIPGILWTLWFLGG